MNSMADTPEAEKVEGEAPNAEAPVTGTPEVADASEYGEVYDSDLSLSSEAPDGEELNNSQAASPKLKPAGGPSPMQPVAFSWNDYKGIRDQQKLISRQEKAQGKKNAFGYHQINPDDKSTLRNLQHSIFNSDYSMLDEEERKRKQREAEYYEECDKAGKPVNDAKKAGFTCYEDKLFDGFRLDKSLGGSPVLSMRLKDEGGRHQQIFDDGKTVKACTNGPFNARTAMGMAAMFWGHRGAQIDPEQGTLKVNINSKKSLGGALGGVTAKEKQDLMIIANLHHSHKIGIQAEITGNKIGDFNQYVQDNQADLEVALAKYKQALPSGEVANFSLGDLLGDPRNEATNAIKKNMQAEPEAPANDPEAEAEAEEKIDEDISLDGGDDNEPPALENDTDTPPENDGGSGGELVAVAAEDAPETLEGEIIDKDEEIDFNDGTSREVDEGWKIVGVNDPSANNIEGADPSAPAALPHDPSLDGQTPSDNGVPTFRSSRANGVDAGQAVASEPRASHGNDSPARSEWVQNMINGERANSADAALGGQDANLPAVPGSKAVINTQPDAASSSQQPERRLPGQTQTPGKPGAGM
jgi:hypothetical protein